MNPQAFQDIVVVGGMFLLRIGVPVLIIFGAGYLIRRWLEPTAAKEQFEGMIRKQQENAAEDHAPRTVESPAEKK